MPISLLLDDLQTTLGSKIYYNIRLQYLKYIVEGYIGNDWKKYVVEPELGPGHKYKKIRVYICPQFDIYILTWGVGQNAKPHDHAENGCIMKVLQGQLKESVYNKNLNLVNENILNTGDVGYIHDTIGYHSIENIGKDIAVTLHVYSPSNHKTKFIK
jgi:predicted metal-dependent enzyme (double-stranded beta helix superfamily)